LKQFEELLDSLGYDYEHSSTDDGLGIFKVIHGERSFIALIFSDESGKPTFVRLMFIVDQLNRESPADQYELLLELNRDCWMGSFAVDVSTSTALYVFNFPLAQFDADALAVAEETFDLSLRLYTDACKE
jgi:hypothetical protein